MEGSTIQDVCGQTANGIIMWYFGVVDKGEEVGLCVIVGCVVQGRFNCPSVHGLVLCVDFETNMQRRADSSKYFISILNLKSLFSIFNMIDTM